MSESLPRYVWIGGEIVPSGEARVSVFDRGLAFAESVYEVLPIVGGAPVLLDEHAARIRHSAERLGIAAGLPPDVDGWRAVCAALVGAERGDEGLVYAQLTGGAAPRAHAAGVAAKPLFFAYLTAQRLPRTADRARPLRAITCRDIRWAGCDLKSTMLLPSVLAKRVALAHGADEAILVDANGEVHEGGSSNVFIVEGERVRTPIQDEHVLPGVTRNLLLALARDAGIDAEEDRVTQAHMLAADEVFITSSSRIASGVVAIDGRPVGGGAVGPMTTRLGALVAARLGIAD